MEKATYQLEPTPIFSLTTVISLSAVLGLLCIAYTASRILLPQHANSKIRAIYIWHFFDFLVHFILEGSFLAHAFLSYAPIPSYSELQSAQYFPIPMTPHGVFFLGQSSRLYGSFYSNGPMAELWKVYAAADRRWGGSDLTIISLEILTVGVMAPLAVYVCYLLQKESMAKAWFVMTVIATGEIYGGATVPPR